MARKGDFIPGRDDDFYNLLKNFIAILEEEVPGETRPKWQAWNIPELKFSRLSESWGRYERLYDRAQAKKNRTAADVDSHREARKELEKFTRDFINQFIRYEDQVPRQDKVRMGVLPKDEEPSPVHGSHLATGAPVVSLIALGGAKIDARFRKTADQTRPSVPAGYGCELRYVIGAPLPPDPEDIFSKTTFISSKARFQVEAGMPNLGKTFVAYARWKHKTNPQLNSQWVKTMEIIIA